MDIGFVTNVVYPFVKGGAQKRVHEIGSRLAADGHDVTVYGRKYWDGPPRRRLDGMRLVGVAPEHELYVGDRRSIVEAVSFAGRALPTLLRRGSNHDVIVVSVFPYFPVASAVVAGVANAVPIVTTWHEVWDEYWEEYLEHFSTAAKVVERATARLPQHPIAVSEVTAARLATIGVGRDTIDVVPNGIDVEQIATVQPVESGYDVLFVGRLIPEKNVDVLLQAFDNVADEHDVTLGVVGDGPAAATVENLAGSLSASDRISFLGFLPDHTDVLAQMRAAEAFVNLSTREGFGISCLEAMAAGCVVIGADHPRSAIGEVVGDAGFVVEPSVDMVTTVLDEVLGGMCPPEDPVDRAGMYDWDRITASAVRSYERALD